MKDFENQRLARSARHLSRLDCRTGYVQKRAVGDRYLRVAYDSPADGLWTLYRFSALDLKQAEQDLVEQATIDINIEAQQEDLETSETCIAAIISIANTGKRNVFLDYAGNPFSANVTSAVKGGFE